MQLDAIRQAQDMGIKTVVLDPNPKAPGFEVADVFYTTDLHDLECIREIAERHLIDGVFTMAAEYPITTLGYLCEELELRGLSRSAAANSTNKSVMRRKLQEGGAGVPNWKLVESPDEAWQVGRSWNIPVIFKPEIGQGSRGIVAVEKGAAKHEFALAFQNAQRASRGGVLLEQRIDGPEYSVEAFIEDGEFYPVAIVNKRTSGAPYFQEIAHSCPADIVPEIEALILAECRTSVRALEIDFSATHIELRVQDGRVYIMEIGARLGGGYINSHLVPLSLGVNMVNNGINLSLGRPLDLEPKCKLGASIGFIVGKPGVFHEITGWDEVCEESDKCFGARYYERGTKLAFVGEAISRYGHVICIGDRAAAAERNVESKLAKLDLKLGSENG